MKKTFLSLLLLMTVTTLNAQVETDVPCLENEWGKYFPSPVSCSVFYICSHAAYSSSLVLYAYECPDDLWYDPESQSCVFPWLSPCDIFTL
ncbi:MAG: chitin binding domain-containing protein [Pedobacter sp.]|uniref:chitin binding peritrophin-A domain-containing protein n=1 Tax=Pedobacter sp. TaxID=1411316 RepID=UPI002809224F|nr:chitin binding domain-containing protein [Pedobacter sp.]MDQ8005182.1 chitin binding domain-containing protein [Pedobacter sp.]